MCDIMDFANNLEEDIQRIPREVNRWQQKLNLCNSIEQDLLHFLEAMNGHLNAWQLARISKKQSQNRIERREAKFKLQKWKHLKGAFYDKHSSARTHLTTAKEYVRKVDIDKRNKMSDKTTSYHPRHYNNLFEDDFFDRLKLEEEEK